MIRINLQDEKTLALNRVIANFVNEHRAKSFSERTPQLGSMVRCVGCGRRHRFSQKCKINYATHDAQGEAYFPDESALVTPQTRKGLFGAAAFAKKRLRPHRHPVTLEILNHSNQLFEGLLEFYEGENIPAQPDITRCISLVRKAVRGRMRDKRQFKHRQQDVSRRINAGLATHGSRPS